MLEEIHAPTCLWSIYVDVDILVIRYVHLQLLYMIQKSPFQSCPVSLYSQTLCDESAPHSLFSLSPVNVGLFIFTHFVDIYIQLRL